MVVTLRPLGACMTISSACTVSPVLNAWAGELLRGDLPPVGPPEGQHVQDLLLRAALQEGHRGGQVRKRPRSNLRWL